MVSTGAPSKKISKYNLNTLQAKQLKDVPWLVHGFSTRAGGFSKAYCKGDLNLGFTKDDSREAVERNRALFLRQISAVSHSRSKSKRNSFWPLITLRQIHSDLIH